ncbi:MAG: hypothetical protein QOD86_88 [Miltoncostaeaceae bacterium]|nr:hypothetical protein [Miltoncostaeaceae bacterium]
MSWWGWTSIGVLAYSGFVALVVRACRWSAGLSRGVGTPRAGALPPLTPAAPGPGPS